MDVEDVGNRKLHGTLTEKTSASLRGARQGVAEASNQAASLGPISSALRFAQWTAN